MALFITHLPPGENGSHCFQQLAISQLLATLTQSLYIELSARLILLLSYTHLPEIGQCVIAQVSVDYCQNNPKRREERAINT